MSKLRSIIRHEYLTIVRQPSFWIAMFAIPVILGVIFALVYLGNRSSAERINEVASSIQTAAVIDKSGLIKTDVVTRNGIDILQSSEQDAAVEAVRTGERDALVVFPQNLTESRTYQIYTSDNDITKILSVGTLADNVLRTSLFLPLGSPEVIALAQNGASSDVTMFREGEQTAGFNDFIAPGLFFILFYIIFAFSVSYMLTSVSEEKENRSMEMVLTYVKPRQLIIGKLLAVCLTTLTQIAFIGGLGILALVIFQSFGSIALPAGIDLAKVTLDFMPIFFGAAFLVVGFLMFAGFMTAVAAAAPSSREANNFSAVFFIGAFAPLYFLMMIITDPENPVVQFLTYFPLSSPAITLIRNTVGNLSSLESWLALGVMVICMIISLWIAVRAFKLGALEYSQNLKLSKLLKK